MSTSLSNLRKKENKINIHNTQNELATAKHTHTHIFNMIILKPMTVSVKCKYISKCREKQQEVKLKVHNFFFVIVNKFSYPN